MQKISIEKKEETKAGWAFEVVLGGGGDTTTHVVFVPKKYWQELSGGRVSPEELVRKSFEFLLEREPKESILREFELPTIEKYFPEFKERIKTL